jgi:hypothetical protein
MLTSFSKKVNAVDPALTPSKGKLRRSEDVVISMKKTVRRIII